MLSGTELPSPSAFQHYRDEEDFRSAYVLRKSDLYLQRLKRVDISAWKVT